MMEYDKNGALIKTKIAGLAVPKRGKVRDIYEFETTLLLIATDRISAFDCVMPNGIPDKGKVLNSLSKFWFEFLESIPNQLISTNVDEYPDVVKPYRRDLDGRSMLVKKTIPLPVECVCRGYLIGSGWKDYQRTGSVCGIALPSGYDLAAQLEPSIFTPAYKAEQGEHDENISYERVTELIGTESAAHVKDTTIAIYKKAADFARTKGIIIADTKLEFGRIGNDIILIDEVLTPDSSRFWPAEHYEPGKNPPSLDKQFVRDYLESQNWGKTPPAPELPTEIVEKTREKYIEAYKKLTGETLQ